MLCCRVVLSVVLCWSEDRMSDLYCYLISFGRSETSVVYGEDWWCWKLVMTQAVMDDAANGSEGSGGVW